MCVCVCAQPFPVQNIMAACRRANVLTPSGERQVPYSVMIVPHGMDLNKYTRPDEMVYHVSGLRVNEHEKVTMPIKNVLKDNVSDLRILVHVPTATNRMGAANPQAEPGGLTELVGISTYYPLGQPEFDPNNDDSDGYSNALKKFRGLFTEDNTPAGCSPFFYDTIRITNFRKRAWELIDLHSKSDVMRAYARLPGYRNYLLATDDGTFFTEKFTDDNAEMILIRPKLIFMMSSAILCTNPGKGTGDLFMGFPFTGVSNSQKSEYMEIK
jgi:hypothetical protein